MLAVVWKKFLLAICIVAIICNVVSKFVNRISLEKTISGSPDGVDVRDLINNGANKETSANSNSNTSNSVNKNNTSNNNYNNISDNTVTNQTLNNL